jgi:hypothetical protein
VEGEGNCGGWWYRGYGDIWHEEHIYISTRFDNGREWTYWQWSCDHSTSPHNGEHFQFNFTKNTQNRFIVWIRLMNESKFHIILLYVEMLKT